MYVSIGATFTKITSHYAAAPGDILIRFSGQKVKDRGHSRRRHTVITSFFYKIRIFKCRPNTDFAISGTADEGHQTINDVTMNY